MSSRLTLFLITLSATFLLGFQSEGDKTQIWLDQSYSAYSSHDYKRGVIFADSAIEASISINDTLGLIRAEFYREISRQLSEGNDYDLRKLDGFRKSFIDLDLWQDEARANIHISTIYRYLGDVQKELENLIATLHLYEENNDLIGVAGTYSDLSLMYYDQRDYQLAFQYIRMAIKIDSVALDSYIMHRDYNNLAIIYEHTGPLDSAIYYQNLALYFAIEANDAYSMGLSLSNLGNDYVSAGEYDQAEVTLKKALRLRDSLGNNRGLSYTHNRLANLYLKQNSLKEALFHAQKSLDYASITGEIKVKRMAYERFEEIARLSGNKADELKYYRKKVALSDSLRNSENTKEITKLLMSYEFGQQQFLDSVKDYQHRIETKSVYDNQLLKERNQRNYSIISGLFFLVLALGAYGRARYIKKAKENLQVEKDRSDELLLNILPSEVAEELKKNGKSEARNFDEVTILFTDFKEFTQAAAALSATDLVAELNECFKAFDEIVSKYQVEKIKTIGDAYMAAGGLPVPSEDSVKKTLLATLEIQEYVEARHRVKKLAGQQSFRMRAGVHTGPVVAGIVGIKKFQYDVWGDTVNTASRVESAGEMGKVNVSQATYELLKNDPDFEFESRGLVSAKGKGELNMYFVKLKGVTQEE